MFKDNTTKSVEKEQIKQMINTAGWKVVEQWILNRAEKTLSELVEGDPAAIDIYEAVALRARYRAYKDLLAYINQK